jgi:DNA-binding NarL/FixJ family response regulator
MATDSLRVVVCADPRLLREALCAYLRQQRGVSEAVAAGDADSAVRECRRRADVLVLDLSLGPDAAATDVLEALRNLHLETPVLTLAPAANLEAVAHAIRLGARGHCPKDARPEVLRDATYAVAAGDDYLHPGQRDQLLAQVAALRERALTTRATIEQLTPREREVLRLLSLGSNRTQIARRLRMSPHTVRTHVTHLMGKLGVNNQVAASARARQLYEDLAAHDAEVMTRWSTGAEHRPPQPPGADERPDPAGT